MKVMLNQILDTKGISQNQLAKNTGISVSTLRNLNHNKTTRINFDILEKICIYLNCNVDDILLLERNWFDDKQMYQVLFLSIERTK